jgi:hypothetical protein
MTLWTYDGGQSLRSILQVQIYPHAALRLPWWVMHGDSHETRPDGLVSQSYHNGHLELHHLKTLMRTSAVAHWRYPLFPQPKNPRTVLLNGLSIKQYIRDKHLHSFEKATVRIADTSMEVPISPVFLRHYMFMSWEEFYSNRAKYKTSSR